VVVCLRFQANLEATAGGREVWRTPHSSTVRLRGEIEECPYKKQLFSAVSLKAIEPLDRPLREGGD